MVAGLDLTMGRLYRPRGPLWLVTIALLSASGCYLMSALIVAPRLPQASLAFQPLVGAVEYLRGRSPEGRMLNDPQFGDVMIWHMKPPPAVFIDTRYDMYGPELVADYLAMADASGNWRQLMDTYQISWVFMMPEAKLVEVLKREANWQVAYRDSVSIVLCRYGQATSAKRAPAPSPAEAR